MNNYKYDDSKGFYAVDDNFHFSLIDARSNNEVLKVLDVREYIISGNENTSKLRVEKSMIDLELMDMSDYGILRLEGEIVLGDALKNNFRGYVTIKDINRINTHLRKGHGEPLMQVIDIYYTNNNLSIKVGEKI